MEVRDAVEADAGDLAGLADAPEDVMRNLVHDRTVRVAYDPEADATDERAGDIHGFVSFDARPDAVHVTQLEGESAVQDLLLDEPVEFATGEGMAVELLVPADEDAAERAARDAGFEQIGDGPRFAGQATHRYRLEPDA